MKTIFNRRTVYILIGLAALVALVRFGGRFISLPAPEFSPTGGEAGPRGPLELVFVSPMQAETVEQRVSLDPPAPGHFAWSPDGLRVSFIPEQALEPGRQYTLKLAAGAAAQNGQEMRGEYSWPVTIRRPEVVYLSPSQGGELWRVAADEGARPLRLTSTGGRVFDFSVSPDGNHIAYSLKNEQRGYDLWEMDRTGGQMRLLIPCQVDWCTNPAYAPDGTRILYVRRQVTKESGGPGTPRLWTLNLPGLDTAMLIPDPAVGGYDLAWSPDGRYLAFFDQLSNAMRVLDMREQVDFLVPSEMGIMGAWHPDGRHILTVNLALAGEQVYNVLEEVDVQSQQVRVIFGSPENPREYSVPEATPDGEWLAIAMRPVSGAMGKQLWLVKPDGSQEQQITDDVLSNYAAYHWDPAGQLLVYQVSQPGNSDARPRVDLWDRATEESYTLAEDAYLPRWIP